MRFDWSIDKEEELSPVDVLGSIHILSNEKKSNGIIVDNIYLDDWFEAIIIGLSSVDNQNPFEVEIPSESHMMIFNKEDNIIHISFGSQKVWSNSLVSDLRDVKQAAQGLLDCFSADQIESNENLLRVEKLIRI